jgi:hypothetical protein
MKINVSSRELDTILAALRLWQRESAHIADGDGGILEIAEEHGDSLTNADVNELCERLNCEVAP